MEIITNAIPHLQSWWQPLKTLGWLLGILFVLGGTMAIGRSRRLGLASHHSTAGALAAIIAGFFLTSLTASMDTFSWTAFHTSAPSVLSYTPPDSTSIEGIMIQFSVYVVNLVGLAGFIRGFWLIRNLQHGAHQFGQAVTHIIGGTFAMNIVEFARMVGVSLGNPIHSTIVLFLG